MSSEPKQNQRQRAQERLTATQDRWIAVLEKFGHDMSRSEVAQARRELEAARIAYLELSKTTTDGQDAKASGE